MVDAGWTKLLAMYTGMLCQKTADLSRCLWYYFSKVSNFIICLWHQLLVTLKSRSPLSGPKHVSAPNSYFIKILYRYRLTFTTVVVAAVSRNPSPSRGKMAYVTVKVWFTAKPVTLAYAFLYCIAVSFTAGTAWPDLANYRHFGKNLHVFDNFLTVYILSCKMVSLHWQICYIIGLVFIVANGQILKNNLTIWLH